MTLSQNSVDDCLLIELNRYDSPRRGNLSVVEGGATLPFPLRRVFHIYDVPGGESRGGHAHFLTKEFIVAVSGSFSVTVDDGLRKKTVFLNRPYRGLLVEAGIWVTLNEFSSGAVALVMTSEHFDPADHIKSYDDFINLRNG